MTATLDIEALVEAAMESLRAELEFKLGLVLEPGRLRDLARSVVQAQLLTVTEID